MDVRQRSIRFRVFLLVVIPVLSLIGVYVFAVGISAGDAIRLARATSVTASIRLPNTRVQRQLDAESLLALAYLGTPTDSNLSALRRQETSTDRAVRQYQATVSSAAVSSNASAAEKQAIAAANKGLARLPAVRAGIGTRLVSRLSAVTFYNNLAIAGFQVYDRSIELATSVPLVAQGLDLTKLGEVDQTVLEETELLTSSLAAGSFPPAYRAEFTELAGSRRFLLTQTLAGLRAPYRGLYDKYVRPQSAAGLTSLENAVIGGPRVDGLPAVPPLAWNAAAGGYALGLAAALQKAGNEIAAQAQDQAHATYRNLALIGSLGLLAILAAIVASVITARRIIRQLAELRQSALELANVRLPSVMRRLRSGEEVDIAAEVLSLPPGSDEIGQVRQAFNLVQRAAVEAATGEARLRKGVSDVFRNLARRSQTLLHRQLTLLDDLERRAASPEELDNLFRIDHLTTRMRRQAESLIVLSGELPGRGWRDPVRLVDVLRAAEAEVEGFARIKVVAPTRAALAGEAVADVIHLVAELAENATSFSPPNTPVQIVGDVVGRGFAIEIEDRGMGLPDERLAEINRDLADPPEFDLSGSDRIGLFIAGQLAQRHKIKITLRNSPFGGISAIVLIPQDLVVPEEAQQAGPAVAGNGGPPDRRAAGRALPGHGTGNGAGPPADSGVAADRLTDLLPGTKTRPAQPLPVNGTAMASPPRRAAAEPAEQDAPADPDLPGLPVRVRQASIAPQLRGAADARPAPDAAARPASPEGARDTMAAMQQGWERGRADSADSGGPDRADQPSSDGH
jgi:signal transduction histidine kinase